MVDSHMKLAKLTLGAAVVSLLLAGCVVAPQQGGTVRSVDSVQPYYTQPYYNQPYYAPYSYPYGYSTPYATPYYQPAYPVYRNSVPAAQVVPVGPASVAPVRRLSPRVKAVPNVRRPAVRAPRPAAAVAPVQR